MKLQELLPKLRLSSSRKARSKALTLSLIVGVLTFAMATVGERIATGKVSSFVVASEDLQAGQVLDDKDLKEAGKVSGVLPPEVFTSKSQAVGLSLAYPIKEGQPIVKGLVSDNPMRDGLYPGEVGVWVSVTLTSSGMAKPGDIVDVYLSSPSSQWGKVDAPQMMSSLQGIRVVAVVNSSGQPVKTDGSNPNSNVPAAVELAIPKSKASEFSQIAAGKVSLMLDPFATPQTTPSDMSIQPEPNTTVPTTSVPNMTPTTDSTGTPSQGQMDAQQPNLPTGAPGSTSNYDSNVQASTPDNYTPPVYNPTTENNQNN